MGVAIVAASFSRLFPVAVGICGNGARSDDVEVLQFTSWRFWGTPKRGFWRGVSPLFPYLLLFFYRTFLLVSLLICSTSPPASKVCDGVFINRFVMEYL